MSLWFVYILRCGDDSLYTGITTDVKRRFAEHQAGTASKYTASRGVEEIIYIEEVEDRSAASKREAEIKQFSKEQKETLVSK